MSDVPVVVLVPGYGGRTRAVEQWRMDVAVRTLAEHGGGRLVVSGYGGEAERLAALAPGRDVVVEPTATSTRENVERSIPFLESAPSIAIATDRFHGRVAERYLTELRPDLAARLVAPSRRWWRGWWIQAGGAVYGLLHAARDIRVRIGGRSATGAGAGDVRPE